MLKKVPWMAAFGVLTLWGAINCASDDTAGSSTDGSSTGESSTDEEDGKPGLPRGEAELIVPPAAMRRIAAPPCAVGSSCVTEFPASAVVEDIAQDDENLYVAVKYRQAHDENALSHSPERPSLKVYSKGLRAELSSARGAVESRIGKISWLEIPLADLPEGESELELATAGTFRVLPLLKKDGTVSWLEESMREGYRFETEVHPVTGQVRGVVTVDGPTTAVAHDRKAGVQ